MTRKERNNKLKYLIACMKCEVSGKCCDDNCSIQYNAGNMGEIIENLEEISKLLEQEPYEDCISRREAIKMFTYNYKGKRIPDYDCDNWPVQIDLITVKEILKELPSVNPQAKTGHWITIDDCELFIAKCSECGEIVDSRMISKYPYCHCGAKMQEVKECIKN